MVTMKVKVVGEGGCEGESGTKTYLTEYIHVWAQG